MKKLTNEEAIKIGENVFIEVCERFKDRFFPVKVQINELGKFKEYSGTLCLAAGWMDRICMDEPNNEYQWLEQCLNKHCKGTNLDIHIAGDSSGRIGSEFIFVKTNQQFPASPDDYMSFPKDPFPDNFKKHYI